LIAQRTDALKHRASEGGPREAVIRALLYVRMPEGVADERGFNLIRQMREEAGKGLTLADFKTMLREQYFMLLVDERRAVEAIPDMLGKDPDLASRMASKLRQVIDVVGVNTPVAKDRLAEIEAILASSRLREAVAAADRGRAQSDTVGPDPDRSVRASKRP
jgi:hypothetical protein